MDRSERVSPEPQAQTSGLVVWYTSGFNRIAVCYWDEGAGCHMNICLLRDGKSFPDFNGFDLLSFVEGGKEAERVVFDTLAPIVVQRLKDSWKGPPTMPLKKWLDAVLTFKELSDTDRSLLRESFR